MLSRTARRKAWTGTLVRERNRCKNALYEGKVVGWQFRRGAFIRGEPAGALVQTLSGFFFMILTPPSGINLIHILFTPGICPPGLRLQIRNHDPTSQEKFGTLFCLSTQKNLDAKSSLALRPVSLGASCLFHENVVRRRPGGSVIACILVCFDRPWVTQKGSPRREFARNSDTKSQ